CAAPSTATPGAPTGNTDSTDHQNPRTRPFVCPAGFSLTAGRCPAENAALIRFSRPLPWGRSSARPACLMTDDDRFRLLFGPHPTPAIAYGDAVTCEVSGDLVVCGLTDAPTPWPTGKKREKGSRARSIVVYAGLAEAVRRESSQAVARWWGGGIPQTSGKT